MIGRGRAGALSFLGALPICREIALSPAAGIIGAPCRLLSVMSNSQRQTCKVCGRADKFDYHVPDRVWTSVVPARLRRRVVCLNCFDDLAYQEGVDYGRHIRTLYFAGDAATLVCRCD